MKNRWEYIRQWTAEIALGAPPESLPSAPDEDAFAASFNARVTGSDFGRLARSMLRTSLFRLCTYRLGHPELCLADERASACIRSRRTAFIAALPVGVNNTFPQYERSFRRFYAPFRRAFADNSPPFAKAYRLSRLISAACDLLGALLGEAPESSAFPPLFAALIFAVDPPCLVSSLAYIRRFVCCPEGQDFDIRVLRIDWIVVLWRLLGRSLGDGLGIAAPAAQRPLVLLTGARWAHVAAVLGADVAVCVVPAKDVRADAREAQLAVFACGGLAELKEAQALFRKPLFSRRCTMVERARRLIFFVKEPGEARSASTE
jgi:hypothetical protein